MTMRGTDLMMSRRRHDLKVGLHGPGRDDSESIAVNPGVAPAHLPLLSSGLGGADGW